MDTPLEALAFFTFVNNLWTWIAAAAVSFWRIRVTTINNQLTEPESIAGPVKETVTKTVSKTETVTGVWEPLVYNDGVTKGKLTMYYEVDVDGGKCDDRELTDVIMDDCEEWWERWEKVVKLRNGDDCWYRYVDLKVINGNVVRLWDDNGVRNGVR